MSNRQLQTLPLTKPEPDPDPFNKAPYILAALVGVALALTGLWLTGILDFITANLKVVLGWAALIVGYFLVGVPICVMLQHHTTKPEQTPAPISPPPARPFTFVPFAPRPLDGYQEGKPFGDADLAGADELHSVLNGESDESTQWLFED